MIQKLYAHDNDPRVMQRIIDLLNDGGIIIYPTDSVYAIGCHALKSNAVERICEIKGVDPQKSHFSIIAYVITDITFPVNHLLRLERGKQICTYGQ